MGGGHSHHPPSPPPPPTVYDTFELKGTSLPPSETADIWEGIENLANEIKSGPADTECEQKPPISTASFGPIGHGKSSTLNLAQSALNGTFMRCAMAGNTGNTITTNWDAYTIRRGSGSGASNAWLWWDTPGELITNLLNDWTKTSDDEKNSKLDELLGKCADNRISCLMLHMAADDILEDPNILLQVYRQLHHKAMQAGIGVTCLVTKIDVIDHAIADRTENVCISQQVEAIRRRVVREVGVQYNQVDVVANFVTEREPQQNHAKCWLGLLALHNAFRAAEDAAAQAQNIAADGANLN